MYRSRTSFSARSNSTRRSENGTQDDGHYPAMTNPFEETSESSRIENESSDGIRSHASSVTSISEGKIVRGVEETRLVIGLDYGTTYTGVAYATPSGAHCKLGTIDVKTDWGPANDEKVPSVISYSRPELEWGDALSADAITMVHTKLELGIQSLFGELEMTLQVLDGVGNLDFDGKRLDRGPHGSPAYSQKSPEMIVTDFLGKVFEYVKQELQDYGAEVRELTSTDIVVTVPTGWSYMAMNSTYRALTKAGFNITNFPKLRDVIFVTEPEAAALYTARHYRDEQHNDILQKGQYFILCDAGGGTVDIVSYKVLQLHPVLELEQIGDPTGDNCGSIYINVAFKKWLRNLLTDEYYTMLDPHLDIERSASHSSETPAMRLLMKTFDSKKRTFTKNSGIVRIDLPPPLINLTLHGKVDQGQITISKEDMESFFDTCVERVADMINIHVQRIRDERENRPKNLFLVGGFSESEYLQSTIADLLIYEDLHMKFRRPDKSWTAVVRGAVLFGVEKLGNKTLRRAKPCRHNYAICLDEAFTRELHSEETSVEIKGGTFAKSQLRWLLNKGDVVLSDQPRTVKDVFGLRLTKLPPTLRVPIYRYTGTDEERPTELNNAKDELEIICHLEIDLSRIKFDRIRQGALLSNVVHQATIRLVLDLSWHGLEASLWWKETELVRQSVAY